MTPSWKQTANPDVLQHMSILTKQIEELTDKLDNNKTNFNECQTRLAKALNEIELTKGIAIENKSLKRVISTRNKKIKSLENSIHDLKGNYGVTK